MLIILVWKLLMILCTKIIKIDRFVTELLKEGGFDVLVHQCRHVFVCVLCRMKRCLIYKEL